MPPGACPACGGNERAPVGSRDAIHLVRCRACTLVYSDPPPVAAVSAKYLEEYDLAAHFATWEPRKRLLYDRRMQELARLAARPGRLFDVGCGNGQFLDIAAEAGWSPSGIELNPPAAARSRARGFAVAQGTIETATDLPWGSFDAVTSWDVLEHTPTPREFMTQLRRLIAPGGIAMVTTLNVASIAWYVFGMRWSMVCEDHFTYWNRRSLVSLAEWARFEVVSCRTFGLGRDFFAVLDRRRRPDGAIDASPSPGSSPRWDVQGAVVAVENAVNACFAVTGGGVGLSVVLRPA